MPEEKEPPRPHGDKLNNAVRPEDNQAQVNSDAPPDAANDPDTRAHEQDDEALRKRQYKNGAELVSGID